MKKIFTVKNLAMALSCSILVGFMVSGADAAAPRESDCDFEKISSKAVKGPSVVDPITTETLKEDFLATAKVFNEAQRVVCDLAAGCLQLQFGNVLGAATIRSGLKHGAELYENANVPKAKTKLGLYAARAKYYWAEFKDSTFAKSTARNLATAKAKVSGAFSSLKSWVSSYF